MVLLIELRDACVWSMSNPSAARFVCAFASLSVLAPPAPFAASLGVSPTNHTVTPTAEAAQATHAAGGTRVRHGLQVWQEYGIDVGSAMPKLLVSMPFASRLNAATMPP